MRIDPESVGDLVQGEGFKRALKIALQDNWTFPHENPTNVDLLLKCSFWTFLIRRTAEGRKVVPIEIYSGICSTTYWWGKFLKDSRRVRWLVSPLVTKELSLVELEEPLLKELRKIITAGIFNQKGGVDPRKASAFFQATRLLLMKLI